MKIDVEGLTFKPTTTQKNFVERRMARALAPFADGIDTVEIWLSELRVGEADYFKRCLVWVELDDERLVIAEHVDANLQVAIHQAANQAAWRVRRCLRRAAGAGETAFAAETFAAAAMLAAGGPEDFDPAGCRAA